MKVKIVLGEGAVVPKKQTATDAGYDLVTAEDICIGDGRVKGARGIAPLNFKIQLPDPCSRWYWKVLGLFLPKYRYMARINPRSGLTLKGMPATKCAPTKGVSTYYYDCDVRHGIVDVGYRNKVGVLVVNRADGCYIPKGTRIAQMTIERCYEVDFEITDKLDTSADRGGGFGHSGH